MPALTEPTWIAPGKIIYQVHGSIIIHNLDKSRSSDIDDYINKLIITSKPINWYKNGTSKSFFSTINCEKEYNKDISLSDFGIGNESNYNLNRIFVTKEEAREFASECILGIFFNINDQFIYDTRHIIYTPFIPILRVSQPQSRTLRVKNKGTP